MYVAKPKLSRDATAHNIHKNQRYGEKQTVVRMYHRFGMLSLATAVDLWDWLASATTVIPGGVPLQLS